MRFLILINIYHSYKKDIAILHLYWDMASVLQFERALRLTWIDYISTVDT